MGTETPCSLQGKDTQRRDKGDCDHRHKSKLHSKRNGPKKFQNMLKLSPKDKAPKTWKFRHLPLCAKGATLNNCVYRLSRFHPPFYILVCFSSFLRQKRHVLLEVRLKSSFFDTVWVYRDSRNAFRGTFGLVFGETNSKFSFDKLAFLSAPAVSLISVRSSRSPASVQRACLSFLGALKEDHIWSFWGHP